MKLFNENAGIATLTALGILAPIAWFMGMPQPDPVEITDVEPMAVTAPAPTGRTFVIPADTKNIASIVGRLQPGDTITITQAAPKPKPSASGKPKLSPELQTLRDALEKSLKGFDEPK